METKNKYSIRKMSAGTASILVGSLLFISPQISADEVSDEGSNIIEETSVSETVSEKHIEEMELEENEIEISDEDNETENESTYENQKTDTEGIVEEASTEEVEETDSVEEIMETDSTEESVEESPAASKNEIFEVETETHELIEENIESAEQENYDSETNSQLTESETVEETVPDEKRKVADENEEFEQSTVTDTYEDSENDEQSESEIKEDIEQTSVANLHQEPVNEEIIKEVELDKDNSLSFNNEENEETSEEKTEQQQEFIVNDDSFEIGEEHGLDSGTYTLLFDSPVDSESRINIHNGEGVLVDSFNIRGNIDQRDSSIKLILNDGDKVDIVGAETVAERIDNVYGENTQYEDEMTVPHGYHEISEEGNIKPGVYRVSHLNRNGDFSIGVIDPESGEFIPRNEDRGNVGRQWSLPVSFYDGETILIENIDHFHLDRIINSEADIDDQDDNKEINPEGSFIPKGYYSVGSNESIVPGTYYFGFVNPAGDDSNNHITFVNLRNQEGELKDRFELSRRDFREEGKDVVLLEGDTFEIVNHEIYFENYGDIYGYEAGDTDRGLYFYLSHGYHEVSEDNEMLIPGTYSVEHMAEGGVISVGAINSETGEFIPKSERYSEMIVHLDNPIDITLSAGEIIKIDRINHLAFNNWTYQENEENPTEEEPDNDDITVPGIEDEESSNIEDESGNDLNNEEVTDSDDSSDEEGSNNGESPEPEDNINDESPDIITPEEVVTENSLQVGAGNNIVGESIAPGTYLITNMNDVIGGNISVWYEDEYGNEIARYIEIIGAEYGSAQGIRVTVEEGDRVSIENTEDMLFTPAGDIVENENELGIISEKEGYQIIPGSYIIGEDIAPGAYTVSNFDELGSNFIVWYENEYGYELARYNEILGTGDHAVSNLVVELFVGDRVSISGTNNLLFSGINDKIIHDIEGEESEEQYSVEDVTDQVEKQGYKGDAENVVKDDSSEYIEEKLIENDINTKYKDISPKLTESVTEEKESPEDEIVSMTDSGDGTTNSSSTEKLPDTGVSQQSTTLFATVLAALGLSFLIRRKKKA